MCHFTAFFWFKLHTSSWIVIISTSTTTKHTSQVSNTFYWADAWVCPISIIFMTVYITFQESWNPRKTTVRMERIFLCIRGFIEDDLFACSYNLVTLHYKKRSQHSSQSSALTERRTIISVSSTTTVVWPTRRRPWDLIGIATVPSQQKLELNFYNLDVLYFFLLYEWVG